MTMNKDWRAKISLRQGDLTDADVDAIVNAANNDPNPKLYSFSLVADCTLSASLPAVS